MDLTPKQRRFADEYLIDLNATAAYKRAGYAAAGNAAEVNAHRLLSNAKVASYIKTLMDKRAEKVGVNAEYVLSTIIDTVERCKQARAVFDKRGAPVMIETPDGEMAQAYVFDAGAVLKGAELLGKHLKLWTDKMEHSGGVGVEITTIERVIIDPK